MQQTAELIRQQMVETKSQLSDKLVTLEQQVTDTVQSTENVVNATVEAVQETVDSVTGAVQGAVQSVSNAFDFSHQVQNHPWMVLGGSFIVGYLAAELITVSTTTKESQRLASDNLSTRQYIDELESSAKTAKMTATSESDSMSSSWQQLNEAAYSTIIGMMQEIATLATTPIAEFLTGKNTIQQSNDKPEAEPNLQSERD